MALIIPILVLLTLVEFWLLRRYIQPPKSRAMGYTFWHFFWTMTIGSQVLLGWIWVLKYFGGINE